MSQEHLAIVTVFSIVLFVNLLNMTFQFKQNRDRFIRTLQGMNAQMGDVVVGLLSLFDDILRKLKVAHDYILKVMHLSFLRN